jgi:hypothetical protein
VSFVEYVTRVHPDTGCLSGHANDVCKSHCSAERDRTGLSKVTGLGVGIRYDGTEVPFFSHGQKVKYYDANDDDTHEVGNNLLVARFN